MKSPTNTERFEMRLAKSLIQEVDAWRELQKVPPNPIPGSAASARKGARRKP